MIMIICHDQNFRSPDMFVMIIKYIFATGWTAFFFHHYHWTSKLIRNVWKLNNLVRRSKNDFWTSNDHMTMYSHPDLRISSQARKINNVQTLRITDVFFFFVWTWLYFRSCTVSVMLCNGSLRRSCVHSFCNWDKIEKHTKELSKSVKNQHSICTEWKLNDDHIDITPHCEWP